MKKGKNNSEPLEYARGFAEFLGCKIDLSKRPLIPRPETEFWVHRAIGKISHNFQSFENCGIRILDIFAGSGCIGLAIEKHVKNAKVTFADKYQYFEHPNFIKSDVFSNIRGKYDLIFANPPYVATLKKHLVQKSVLEHEPHSALFAGPDGFFYIKKFLRQARAHLSIDGKMFMEFSPEQKPEIAKLVQEYGYKKCQFHKDQFGRYRWVEISR